MTKSKMRPEVEIRRRIAELEMQLMGVKNRAGKDWYHLSFAISNLKWALGDV